MATSLKRILFSVAAAIIIHGLIALWIVYVLPSTVARRTRPSTIPALRTNTVELAAPRSKPTQPMSTPVSPRRPVGSQRAKPANTTSVSREASVALPVANEPVDLTDMQTVAGGASAYAGGVVGGAPGNGLDNGVGAAEAGASMPNYERPVALSDTEWQCPWPKEAEPLAIDEQSAIVRVLVASDGHARQVELMHDPGNGFGAAAVACARTAHWQPARDARGTAIQRWSPPIKVRFTR